MLRSAVLAWVAIATLTPNQITAQGPEGTAGDRSERVGLAELPALARARSARQRPVLLTLLEPFLVDLKLDYRRNAGIIDDTLDKVARLGDGIAPILLDNLTPSDASRESIHLAENSARILARFDLAPFVDSLVEAADGDAPTPRRLAIDLLGRVGGDSRAVDAIARAYPRLEESYDRKNALQAMAALRADALREQAETELGNGDPELRGAALRYLHRIAEWSARDRVLIALRGEKEGAILGDYLGFLRDASLALHPGEGDAQVANAFLDLLEGTELDRDDSRFVLEALAEVSPKGHDRTRDVLRRWVEQESNTRSGLVAARTLDQLGDRRAKKLLFEKLDEAVRRNRGSAKYHATRADAYFAFGEFRDAIRDYEQAAKNSYDSSMKALHQLAIARCEAHQDRIQSMVAALKDAEVSADTIRKEAADDPVFAQALERDLAKRFLRSLDDR